MVISPDIVTDICPALDLDALLEWLPTLEEVMERYEINTPLRKAAFIAQLAHESGQFRYFEEIWGPTPAQRKYEPTYAKGKKLGNKRVGDGKRYKGRGPIQITGRANYAKYGMLLGLDLITHPELAATPKVGFEIAGLYWKLNGLNQLADKQHFKTITKRINGGFNGLQDRLKYYHKALARLLAEEDKLNAKANAGKQLEVPSNHSTGAGASGDGST